MPFFGSIGVSYTRSQAQAKLVPQTQRALIDQLYAT